MSDSIASSGLGQSSNQSAMSAAEKRVAVLTVLCLFGFAVLAVLVMLGKGDDIDRHLLLEF